MKSDDRNVLYIQRILEYCDRIEAAVSRFGDSYDNFINDADYRDAVCMASETGLRMHTLKLMIQ